MEDDVQFSQYKIDFVLLRGVSRGDIDIYDDDLHKLKDHYMEMLDRCHVILNCNSMINKENKENSKSKLGSN